MNRTIRVAAVAVIALAAAGAWACSDDDNGSLTLEEYFAKVDAIDNATTEEIDGAFEGFTDENDIEQFKTAFKVIGPVLGDAADDLDDIDPPDEAKEEHDALAKELREFADTTTDLGDNIDDIEASTPEELFAAFEERGFSEADEQFSAACLALQQVGADNGIVVDLGCEDGED